MRRATSSLLAAVLGGMVATAPVEAVSVAHRQWASAEAFARGTLDGTQVSAAGRLTLGPEIRALWGPREGVVWSVAPDGLGGAFVALSGPGRLIRVGADSGAQSWYEGPAEALVTAAATDGRGGIFFAVGPGGEIRHADGPSTSVRVADTEAEFVWALAVEADGTLWAGTGGPGRVLRVRAGGTPEVVFESGDDPVRCLTTRAGGGVVAGTGQRGRVVRIDAAGEAFVVLDAEEEEIASVAVDARARIFALATRATGRRPTKAPGRGRGETATVNARMVEPSNDEEGDEAEEVSAQTRRPTRARRSPEPGGAVYRLDPDGGQWRIWEAGDESPYALVLDADGMPLVGTGDDGRVVRMDADGRASRVLRFASNVVSALARDDDDRVFLGGSDDARLAALGPGTAAEGRFETDVLDAGSVADWGRVEWEADVPRGASFRLRARSGNTTEPDETWSPWTGVEIDAGTGAPVRVPAARWLQVQILLAPSRSGEAPSVGRLDVHYQPRNRPPRIRAIEIEPPGVAWSETPRPSNARGGPQVTGDPVSERLAESVRPRKGRTSVRRSFERGARTAKWSAEDPDGDALEFGLDVRAETGDEWFPLARGVTGSFHSWDSRSMPDGIYRLRLIADDSIHNAPGEGLSRRHVSDPFLVDNTAPSVEPIEVARREEGFAVSFRANDRGGRVASAEYSVADGPWRRLEPADGIADSASELYRFTVADAAEGTPVRVRVSDASGNLGGRMLRLR